jgi:molybdopterin-containing oxidoreductase family molybdopterin binding subunit
MTNKKGTYDRLEKEREDYRVFGRNGSKDYWAYTICGGCFNLCGIRVRVVDGAPVTAEGLTETDMGAQGGLCGKGVASILHYHDPNRCNYPVKRTNPKKGIGEDPKWERISWDEALDTIAEKLNAVRKKDPRSLVWACTPAPGTSQKGSLFVGPFFITFGSFNRVWGGVGTHCGSAPHHVGGLVHAAWDILPDYRYANYVFRCGGNEGVGLGRMASTAVRQCATARDRGMRMVVMDPIGYISGAKAQEWVPILPGTDSAVFLAMANLIVNEIGIYDKEYLRERTNAPYLVGPDKLFVRDKESGKPLLWDEKDNTVKTYDDSSLAHPALEGDYEVYGTKCRPAFHLLKEHLKQYEPEWASKVSTVPEAIIRRFTKELVEAAKIGSTIEINGVKIPYRPACMVGYKGIQGHQNGFHQYASMCLINSLLGNQDTPGGILGSGTARGFGHPDTGRPAFGPYAGYDGMVTPGMWFTQIPWPPADAKGPALINLIDLFPHSGRSSFPYTDDWDEIWTKAGRPYEAEVMALWGANVVMNVSNSKVAEKFLKKIPFTFSINIQHNETTEGFADIVLPECNALESLDVSSAIGFMFNYPIGMDRWSFHPGMPVVEPKYERRDTLDIFFDLADRVGIRAEYNAFLEGYFSGKRMTWEQDGMKEFDIIKPDERIRTKEFTDRVLKYYFGEERGLAYFMEHGFMTWDKRPEEAYWRYFVNTRLPIYYETNESHREHIRTLAEKVGIHMEWEQYTALPTYFSPVIYTELPPDSEFDLVAFSPHDVLHTHRFSAENPWLDEMSKSDPYVYHIVMNAETARGKGISEGDAICVENRYGDKVKGKVRLTQLAHPKVMAIVGLGSWAKGMPLAQGKGVNFNDLLRADHKHMCPILLAQEVSVRVKAYKVEAAK